MKNNTILNILYVIQDSYHFLYYLFSKILKLLYKLITIV